MTPPELTMKRLVPAITAIMLLLDFGQPLSGRLTVRA
jgi:hypothetical protein